MIGTVSSKALKTLLPELGIAIGQQPTRQTTHSKPPIFRAGIINLPMVLRRFSWEARRNQRLAMVGRIRETIVPFLISFGILELHIWILICTMIVFIPNPVIPQGAILNYIAIPLHRAFLMIRMTIREQDIWIDYFAQAIVA